jgi:glycosyltransferase involved in cell wall biosynthesis
MTLVGDGPEKKKIYELIQTYELENKVKLAGLVDDIEDYYRKNNIYIHAANYEPFGLVILEAMSSGLPVICLDGKGNRDIINHEENGFIFNQENPDLFVKQILKLFNNKKLYTQTGLNII